MKFADLTPRQLSTLVLLERISSCLSLAGILWILLTFLFCSHFHSPINRMLFQASAGNIFVFIATFMARAAVDDPDEGFCQFQGFLIQTFLSADALFSFAMALNIFLTFEFRVNPKILRRLEWFYSPICYGIPSIIGLVFLGIKSRERGKFYGNAGLWCWISPEWEIFRIATFYAPVWAVQLATFGLLLWVGRIIFREGRNLKRVQHNSAARQARIQVEQRVTITGSVNISQANGNSNDVHISAAASPSSRKFRWSDLLNPFIVIKRATALSLGRVATSNMTKYAIVAFLMFFLSQLIWLPASANRVYAYIHRDDDQISLPLTYFSATVLPLQGFVNSVIYTFTSWVAVKLMWRDFRRGRLWPQIGLRKTAAAGFAAQPGEDVVPEFGAQLQNDLELNRVQTTRNESSVSIAETENGAEAKAGEMV